MEKHAFKCDGCVEVFDTKTKVLEHRKAIHGFKCGKCDESFELSEKLTSHQDETHRSCETCEDEFVWAETGHSCSYTDCKPLVEPIYSTRPAEGKTIGNVVQSMKDCLSKVEVQEYRWIDTKQMLADILQRVEDRKPPKDVLREDDSVEEEIDTKIEKGKKKEKERRKKKEKRKKRTQWGKIVNPSFHWFPLFPRDLTHMI